MAQFSYTTKTNGKEVEVLLGYDDPLQRYFLVIEFVNIEDWSLEKEYGKELLYSNLDDTKLADNPSLAQTFEYFAKVLSDLDVEFSVKAKEFIRFIEID